MFDKILIAALCVLVSACAGTPPAHPNATAPAAAPTTASKAAAPANTAALDPDEMICVFEHQTGSRLPQQRICKTRQDWQDERERDQEWLRDNQRSGQPQH